MKKEVLSFFFLFLMFVCACPLAAQTSISDADELAAVAAQCSIDGCEGQSYELTADITLPSNWMPIGTAAKPFKGSFNGNGHIVSGLMLLTPASDGVGLFGHVAAGGVIEKVGMSGQLVAPNCRRVGAIAGVCDGTISECWSMAFIEKAGTMVGGLVGELKSNGKIMDCYHSGLVYEAADTIGAIVGRNSGSLARVYNSGYARNGKAIVGVENILSSSYAECYFDRKAYYMLSGSASENIVPMDVTADMFDLFAENAKWNTAANRYPILDAFKLKTAATLSAAPLFINIDEDEPINHANDLTRDFTVSIDGGIIWSCQNASDEAWIHIVGANVEVERPCSQTDVLVDATLLGNTRVVYMQPRRLTDFIPGKFAGERKEYCFDSTVYLATEITTHELAKYGGIESDAEYYYMVTRDSITAGGDTIPFDTLRNENLVARNYNEWFSNFEIPTDRAGEFVLRRYAHDADCNPDWKRSEGQFIYRVYPEFKAGEIENLHDTIYLDPKPLVITLNSVKAAEGGDGNITYTWYLNNGETEEAIGASNMASLIYSFDSVGTYIFRRLANDGMDCGRKFAAGVRTVDVFEKFDPGEVQPDSDPKTFCTVEEAKAFTVNATEATGGSGVYKYQWYIQEGTAETIIAGATTQNLVLSGVTLEAGKDYTFVRKAEDNTRFTTLTLSREEQKIHIMAALNPGIVKGGEQDNFCAPYNASSSTLIEVSIDEVAPAVGDAGNMEYRWLRIGENDEEVIDGSNTAELQTSFPLSDLSGQTFTFVREVRNIGCDWQRSVGEYKIYYGQDSRAEVVKTICKERLPYTMTKGDSTHVFTADGQSWLVVDGTKGKCSEDTLFIIRTVAMPVFKIDTVAHVCQEEQTLTLHYEKTAGQSDKYRITYSPHLASIIGRTGESGIITEEGKIVIVNVPPIDNDPANFLDLEIGYAGDATSEEDICYSDPSRMRLNFSLGGYLHTKYDRVLFVDNNPNNGIETGGESKLKFVSYQWYKNDTKLEGETGQYYHEGGKSLIGSFYVILTDTKGHQYRSCEVTLPTGSVSPAPQQTLVYPVPVNAGEQITIEGEGTAQLLSFAGERVSQSIRVEGMATISAPLAAGIYYMQITTPDGTMEMHKLIVK